MRCRSTHTTFLEMRDDVELLEHATSIRGDISDHVACGYCRANMIRTNASCPWCRTEMVWRNLYGFLDGLKVRRNSEGFHFCCFWVALPW